MGVIISVIRLTVVSEPLISWVPKIWVSISHGVIPWIIRRACSFRLRFLYCRSQGNLRSGAHICTTSEVYMFSEIPRCLSLILSLSVLLKKKLTHSFSSVTHHWRLYSSAEAQVLLLLLLGLESVIIIKIEYCILKVSEQNRDPKIRFCPRRYL